MAWVKSEYAGEFAVLSAWLAMVLPWNVVYYPNAPTSPVRSLLVVLRLSVFEVQFRFPGELTVNGEVQSTAAPVMDRLYPGTRLFMDVYVASPVGAVTHYAGSMQWGSVAWALGALALLSSLVVSLALYRLDEQFQQRYDVDPVRLIGGLLGVATLAMAAATVFYFLERDLAGVPIPIGVLVMGALSAALLRVDRK